MKCPHCNKEMKDKSYAYYGIGSWDMDYPDCYHEEFVCKTCKISYINEKWHIPDNLIATEKQIKTAIFIHNVLGCSIPAHTKKCLWKYINTNLQNAIQASKTLKQQREQAFEEWCEDNSDWLPEYF